MQSYPPEYWDHINEYYSVEHWEQNWEELFGRVENGETIGIVDHKGQKAVMTPIDGDIMRIHKELNNDAP